MLSQRLMFGNHRLVEFIELGNQADLADTIIIVNKICLLDLIIWSDKNIVNQCNFPET